MVEHHAAHDAPAQARAPAQGGVDVGGAHHTLGDKVINLSAQRRLQTVGDMPRHFLVEAYRPLPDRRIKFRSAPDRRFRGLCPADDLDQRDHVWRIEGVNFRFEWDAPGDRPNRLSAGQAVSTNFLSAASAFGAMSVATTCSPLARYSEVQLAPITPVPMMAMRRMGLVSVMSISPMRLSDFGIGNAGEVALCVEEISFTESIEPCAA